MVKQEFTARYIGTVTGVAYLHGDTINLYEVTLIL